MRNPTNQRDLFAQLPALPQGLVYQSNFVSEAEEAALLAEIRTLPLHEAPYKSFTAKRRIMSFGAEYDFGANQLLPGPPLAPFLFPLENQFTIRGRHFNFIAGFEFAEEQFRGEGIEHEVLDGALERPGPKLRVETFPGDQLFG